MRTVLLLGLLGCHGDPVDTGGSPSITTTGSSTATTPGTTTAWTTGTWPGDTVIETVTFVEPEPTAPELCSVILNCPGEILDDPEIRCDLEVWSSATTQDYAGGADVQLRGRSSQGFPKHQYSIELRDTAGSRVNANLVGMGGESEWVLNGAYIDRSLFRNKLGFDSFQAMGGEERYAPESAFCELTLDGTWLGVFLLTESVLRDDDRVVIDADSAGDGSTFIVKQEDSGGLYPMTMAYGTWEAVYPKQADLTATQRTGIISALSAWEGAVLGPDPSDPNTGIFAYVDLDAAVDLVLLEEFVKNNDAYYLSLHAWRDTGGKLHFVPWDLDLSMGQPYYNDNAPPTGFIAYRPAMIANMATVPAFRDRLVSRWAELRAGPLKDGEIADRIDTYQATLGKAVYANFEVWPIEDIQFAGDQLYPVSSYDEEVTLVRKWLRDRAAWMDANIANY